MLLYVHRNRRLIRDGWRTQDGHLDFHTAPELCVYATLVECCFTSIETVGLLGTGAQDGHLDFHIASEFWLVYGFQILGLGVSNFALLLVVLE